MAYLILTLVFLASLPIALYMWAMLFGVLDGERTGRHLITSALIACAALALAMLIDRAWLPVMIAAFLCIGALQTLGFFAMRRWWVGVEVLATSTPPPRGRATLDAAQSEPDPDGSTPPEDAKADN